MHTELFVWRWKCFSH